MSVVSGSSNEPRNRTIDDNNGDSVTGAKPTYTNGWAYGPSECAGCFVQPDVDGMFDQSWHDVTSYPDDSGPQDVSISFNGTAVWVYGVVPNYVPLDITFINVSFELNGKVVGVYTHVPSDDIVYEYNVTLYSDTTLANAQHTLVMTPQREPNASYLAFDRAQYTYEGPPPSTSTGSASNTLAGATGAIGLASTVSTTSSQQTSSRTPAAAIAGGVIGAVGLLALVATVYHRRRHGGIDKIRILRRRKAESADIKPAMHVDPFMDPSMSEIDVHAVPARMRSQSRTSLLASPKTTPLLRVSNATISDDAPSFLSPAALSAGTAGMSHEGASPRSLWVSPTNTPVGFGDSGTLVSTTSNSFVPTGSPASAAPRRVGTTRHTTKASRRREELSRQVRDIESTVANLHGRQSSQSALTTLSPGSVPIPPLPGGPPPEGDDSGLRRQIEVLQLEVERLRAEQEDVLLREPPPAYVYDEEHEGP